MDKDKLADLDWLQLKKDMDLAVKVEEPLGSKLKRRMLDNPLVPIGCAATVSALTYGLISFRRGDKIMSQKMMRARVLAQAFTIAVAVGGLMIAAAKKSGELTEQPENKQKAVA